MIEINSFQSIGKVIGIAFATNFSVGYDIQKDPDVGYGYRFDQRIESLIQEWAPRTSKAIALSDSVIPDLRDVGVQDDRIQVIPCGVDQPRFESTTVDQDAVRKKY